MWDAGGGGAGSRGGRQGRVLRGEPHVTWGISHPPHLVGCLSPAGAQTPITILLIVITATGSFFCCCF